MTANTENDRSSTRTVDRALDLLSTVLEGEAGDTLSDLARAAGLSPSTASRLLATLVKHRFVSRSDSGRFSPGLRVKQLASRALVGDPLYELCGPHLRELVDKTHETASLGVPSDDEVLYLRQIPSQTHQVQTVVWTGRTIPRVGTAMGAALDLDLGPHSFRVSRRADSDVSAVAAPVLGVLGEVVGALSINAPAYRTSDDDMERYGLLVAAHARRLSLTLGAPMAVIADVFTSGIEN